MSELDGSAKFLRFLLFAFNLLFALCGLVMIGTGGVLETAYREYWTFVDGAVYNAPVVLMITGGVLFAVTLIGCCGAFNSSRWLTLTFGVLAVVALLGQCAAAALVYANRHDVRVAIKRNLETGLASYGAEHHAGNVNMWNAVQNNLACCGVASFQDWRNATSFDGQTSVPDSCCLSKTVKGCGEGVLNMQPEMAAKIVNDKGCLPAIEALLLSNIAVVASVGVGLGVVQVLGICLAFAFAKKMQTGYQCV